MGWYIELHCDGPDDGPCPHGHGEEGPQGNSINVVSREARKAGWGNDRKGRWRCPPCLAGDDPKPVWLR